MYKIVKRTLDLLFAVLILVVSSPLFLFCLITVKISSKGPSVFKQKRIGRNGKTITIMKFRTMRVETEKEGKQLSDSERMTKAGYKLRKYSLDELPQLLNIIKGDMSFIGPRPLLLSYYPYYTPEENRRHDVLPGITGLAQINGRNLLNWDERLQLDIEYVDNISFQLDLKILFKTIEKVIKREGIIVRDKNPMLNLDKERAGHEYREIPSN